MALAGQEGLLFYFNRFGIDLSLEKDLVYLCLICWCWCSGGESMRTPKKRLITCLAGIEGVYGMETGTYGKFVINTLGTDYRSMQNVFRSLQSVRSRDCFEAN